MRKKFLLPVIIPALFILSGCGVQSRYETRTKLSEDEVRDVEALYQPPEAEGEETAEIEPFLEGVNGPAIRVNGIDILAEDIREMYDYLASFRDDASNRLKMEAVQELMNPVIVMSQFPGTIESSKAQLEAIRQQVNFDGANFEGLIVENSQEPGAETNAGDLGTFGRGAMVKPFELRAFTAPVGEVVGPFATVFGWHLLRVTERNTDDPDNPQVSARHLLLFHGLDPAAAEEFSRNLPAWTRSANIEMLVDELVELFPRYAPAGVGQETAEGVE